MGQEGLQALSVVGFVVFLAISFMLCRLVHHLSRAMSLFLAIGTICAVFCLPLSLSLSLLTRTVCHVSYSVVGVVHTERVGSSQANGEYFSPMVLSSEETRGFQWQVTRKTFCSSKDVPSEYHVAFTGRTLCGLC